MIHPTAIINENVSIEPDVEIGPYSIVHSGAKIASGTKIGSHCEIGVETELAKSKELNIGKNSIIRSHSVFYSGSSFGPNLITGHRVTIRENTVTGLNFQVGTLSDIQGDSEIGDYVRFHSNVHVGKGSKIYDFVWIFPYVVLTNDPHPPSETRSGIEINKYAVIATMSTVLPGVVIHEGALIGAHSLVNRDVLADTIVAGIPAKLIGPTSRIKLSGSKDVAAYPWRKHFHRGYPEDLVKAWKLEFGE
jgi:acetyltransferase-like isoleucine patch superfamily enzyme